MNNPTENQEATTQMPEDQAVLLVDDDAKLLRGLQRHFDSEPFRLYTAISPAEANVILANVKIDLVLSDNLMAGMLGTEFLAQVRAKYPDIKLMILSGYLPYEAAQRVTNEIGVARVLVKPCDANEVSAAIRETLSSPTTCN